MCLVFLALLALCVAAGLIWFAQRFCSELLVLKVRVNAGRFGFVRTTFCGELPVLQVGVNAGLLLSVPSRVICWLFSLSLLVPVRDGTSFLGPSATKKQKQRKRLPTAKS